MSGIPPFLFRRDTGKKETSAKAEHKALSVQKNIRNLCNLPKQRVPGIGLPVIWPGDSSS